MLFLTKTCLHLPFPLTTTLASDTRAGGAMTGKGRHPEVATPSLLSRVLSGSVGATLYVCGFTPLEVVKVRQQAADRGGFPVKAFLGTRRGLLATKHGLTLPASAFPRLAAPHHRASTSAICSRLLDLTAHHARPGQPAGIVGTLRSIARLEGRAGLYAGLTPTLLATVPNTAIYFTAYDEITSLLRRDCGAAPESSAGAQACIPLVAAATARFVSSVATAPLDLIRTRQAGSIAKPRGANDGVLGEFRHLLRSDGPRALYRGLGPMILRDVPFSALFFLGFETCKDLLSESHHLGTWGVRYYEDCSLDPPLSVDYLRTFLSGTAAGALATVATTPFDVVKTQSQMAPLGGETQAHGSPRADAGTLWRMRQVTNKEGFFAGLWKVRATLFAALLVTCPVLTHFGNIWLLII